MKARIKPLFLSLIVVASAGLAQGATYNWNGLATGGATGVSETWDTVTANWTGTGTVWPTGGADNDAAFGGTAGTVSLSGPVVANDLTFSTANYKIEGQTLYLGGTTPTITNTVTAEISAVLGGTAGLTKKEAGILVLSGPNYPLGGSVIAGIAVNANIVVNDGILRLADNKAAGTGTLVVNGGYQRGRAELSGGVTLSNAITLQGRQGFTYSAITNNGGDNTLSGAINVVANGARLNFNSSAGKFTVSGAAMTGSSGRVLTFRGAAYGVFAKSITSAVVGSLDKLDGGTWILSGNNTYTGATGISGGNLIVKSGTGLGTGNVSVTAGAALNYAAAGDAPLAIGGTLTVNSGANSAIGGAIGATTTSASINVTGAATITDAAHNVNIFGIPGVTPTTGTYTLLSGGVGSVLNPATAPTLGKVYNNTNFTVGSLSRTATTLEVDITPATALTTAYWDGGLSGADNVWSVSDGSTASNWLATDGGASQPLVPGEGTAVVISTSSPTTAPTATVLGADMSIERLTIADTANGLGLNAEAYSLTISPTDSEAGITMEAGVPASTIAAAVVLGQPQTWTNLSDDSLTVSGSISGANDLIKKGEGTLVLSGNNSYTGVTRAMEGALEIGSVNALSTTTLEMDELDTGSVSFVAPGTKTYNIGALSGSRDLDAGGNPLSIGGTNLSGEFSGALGNTALTKVGSGTLTLAGDNTFTGNVTHLAGKITLAHSNALGVGPKTVYMQGGSRTLFLTNDITLPSNITIIAASNSFDGGGINNESGNNTIQGQINYDTGNPALNISSADGTLTITGNITLTTSDRTLYLGGSSEQDNTISGDITESAAIMPVIKQGAGKWILSGTNTYKGDTSVNGGTLVLENGGSTRFLPKADASSNKITGNGTGTLTLNGALDIDLTDTAAAPDLTSWLLVDVDNVDETFSTNFTVTGFTESPAGTWTKTEGSDLFTFTESDGRLVKTAASGSPFATWMSTNFPAITAPNNDPDDDPDGDGVNNLAEFAFSGDPGDGSNNGLQRSAIDNISGTDHLTYTFACRSADPFTGTAPATVSKDGVDYSVRASLDLSAFTLAVDEVSPAITTGLPTVPSGYTYRTFRVTDARTANPKAFIQVKTSPTP